MTLTPEESQAVVREALKTMDAKEIERIYQFTPLTVKEIFEDYSTRKKALLRALTTESEEFLKQCIPGNTIDLCLFGSSEEKWEVKQETVSLPLLPPEPMYAINISRANMQDEEWLSLVAIHTDVWLIALASYFAARSGFDKKDRAKLFELINELPSLFKDVSEAQAKKQSKEKTSTSSSSRELKGNYEGDAEPQAKILQQAQAKNKEKMALEDKFDKGSGDTPTREKDEGLEEKFKDPNALCGACGKKSPGDEFWIFCEFCGKWYHGNCVQITPKMADDIKDYKCESCV